MTNSITNYTVEAGATHQPHSLRSCLFQRSQMDSARPDRTSWESGPLLEEPLFLAGDSAAVQEQGGWLTLH